MKTEIVVLTQRKSGHGATNGPKKVVAELINALRRQAAPLSVLYYSGSVISKVLFLVRVPCFILVRSRKSSVVINVHSESFFLSLYAYFLSGLFPASRFFLTVHGIVHIEREFLKRHYLLKALLERFILRRFPNLICVSEMLKNDIERLFGRSKNVHVILNGVKLSDEFSRIDSPVEQIKLITTGGIKKRKGIFELIDMIATFNEESRIKVSLDVYGGYTSPDELIVFNDIVKSKGLSENIYYRGTVEDPQLLMDEYSKAHFNMCLSHYDTFNLAVLESMSIGTIPIVSSKTGASQIVRDFKNGFIVDLTDKPARGFSAIMNLAISNSEHYQQIRYKAFQDSKVYSWANIAGMYLKLFAK